MKKSTLNFIIDAIMLLLMGLLTGIGLLIKYVLLSGEDRWVKYGKNVDISFCGLDRHDWGRIHLIVAIILIVFLVLHIIFHWKMIVCLCKGLISGKVIRVITVFAFVLIAFLLVVFPFLIQTEINDLAPGKERYQVHSELASTDSMTVSKSTKYIESSIVAKVEEKHEAEHHHVDPSIEVKGYMTLLEVSQAYDISCDVIKEKLEIPSSVSNKSQLGHLRKQYSFKMSDVEFIIANYKN